MGTGMIHQEPYPQRQWIALAIFYDLIQMQKTFVRFWIGFHIEELFMFEPLF